VKVRHRISVFGFEIKQLNININEARQHENKIKARVQVHCIVLAICIHR